MNYVSSYGSFLWSYCIQGYFRPALFSQLQRLIRPNTLSTSTYRTFPAALPERPEKLRLIDGRMEFWIIYMYKSGSMGLLDRVTLSLTNYVNTCTFVFLITCIKICKTYVPVIIKMSNVSLRTYYLSFCGNTG